jgi:hypothetical protein
MERTKIYYLHYGDNVPIYVGKSNRIQGRIPSHRKKFGSDIVIEILDDVSLHEWKFWECFWIEQFKQWGYVLSNKNNGGGGATKQNFSPIRSQKISKARLGKPMPHKGKKFTEEHKEKIKSTRGFLQSRPNTWTNQPVLQYNLDGTFIREFGSQLEASYFLQVKGDGVGACCRGKQKSAYGYIWKFKNITKQQKQ